MPRGPLFERPHAGSSGPVFVLRGDVMRGQAEGRGAGTSADYADCADCGDFQRNFTRAKAKWGRGCASGSSSPGLRPGARVLLGLAATRRGAAGFRVSLPAAPGFLVFVPPLDRRAALPRRPSFAQATVGTAHPTGCRQDACGTSQGRDSRRRGGQGGPPWRTLSTTTVRRLRRLRRLRRPHWPESASICAICG